ncbi:SDR family oxidoreductase [Oribacterium sp. WCC10]|uniref:SDR family oxidoreductase n=1 Tax=Oribacterium sp. WCC10 TaxID=1855343 RepID=UPI0008F32050|nr:SDR family oxidoreductase [Oribacterium sp. WCC10]SFG15168.1 Short-chain dehydrogenase [Oribacterium sp. WCC10]
MRDISKKKTAIVTGASSGIGRAIAGKLVAMGYEVYGIGRTFSDETSMKEGFHPVICDLRNTKELLSAVREIVKIRDTELKVLVNNAGAAYYGLHETLDPEKIQEMVRVNLEVPLVLTQQLLKYIRENKGNIINISSVTAVSSSPHGACYGATKAGLMSFGRSLFDEVRKHGVRVTTILPDMTDTALYRNADFEADDADDAHLDPMDVADAVGYILGMRGGVSVPEIMLRPQIHRIKKKKN